MKAISTKVLPWTTHKPRRIKAYTEGGNSITLRWDACDPRGDNQGKIHLTAALALCYKMDWSPRLVGGGTGEGYVFCFLDSRIKTKVTT